VDEEGGGRQAFTALSMDNSVGVLTVGLVVCALAIVIFLAECCHARAFQMIASEMLLLWTLERDSLLLDLFGDSAQVFVHAHGHGRTAQNGIRAAQKRCRIDAD